MNGKKTGLISAMLLILPVVAASAETKEQPAPWYERMTVGGELRLRSETQLNYAPLAGGVDDDSFVLLRARPHIDALPVEGLRIFIQPQFSRAYAQEESTIAGNADAANPNNVFDLHQGFLEMSKIGGSPATLRVGRQELVYGDERLVGAFGWSNIGRSFDAAKLRLGWERFWLDGFFAWNESAGGNEYFSGLYGSMKEVMMAMGMDGYVLLLKDNDGDGVAGLTGLTLVTIGHRMFGRAWDDRIDYNTEMALQAGKSSPNNHMAHAMHVAGGHTWKTVWQPRLGLEFNYASGDRPGTATVERFNNLFPTNHDKYGFIDFASWRNIFDIVGSVGGKPSSKTALKLDYHLFLLPEPADGMFRASGALLRAGAAGASRLAGHEIDLLTKWQTNKHLAFLGGYSLFKGGSFFNDTGVSGTAHFLNIQTQASF